MSPVPSHPGDRFKLDHRVGVFIPTGHAINPIAKTHCDGTGVTPDVSIQQEQALLTAQIASMRPLVDRLTESWRKEGATKNLLELQDKLDQTKATASKQQVTRKGSSWIRYLEASG